MDPLYHKDQLMLGGTDFASTSTEASSAVLTPAVLHTYAMDERQATLDTFVLSNRTKQRQPTPKAADQAPTKANTDLKPQEETVTSMGEATTKGASSNLTPINVDCLEKELANHPDPIFARRLC